MKRKESSFATLATWVVVLAGVVAGAYFAQYHPLRVRQEAICSRCGGAGRGGCVRCEGFGTVDTTEPCPKCAGAGTISMKFGNKPRNAPCTRCGSSGQVAGKRIECPVCHGTPQGRCAECGGRGRIATPDAAQTVVMDLSLWDRLRSLLKMSGVRNPRPWRWPTGAYPIVRRHLEIRAGGSVPRVVSWGEFEPAGAAWRMAAEVEFRNASGQTRTQTVEFIVRNRVLETSRAVR